MCSKLNISYFKYCLKNRIEFIWKLLIKIFRERLKLSEFLYVLIYAVSKLLKT